MRFRIGLLALVGLPLMGMGQDGTFRPQWQKDLPVSSKRDISVMVPAPWFAGASLDRDVVNLPYYDVLVPVGADEELVVASATAEGLREEAGQFRQSLAEAGIRPSGAWYPGAFAEAGEVEQRQGKYFQHVRVYPVRVSASGDRVQKADAVSYSVRRRGIARRGGPTGTARLYAANSVLSSGDWYKLAVVRDGVYRLDYAYFQQIGVDPSTISPATVRIHNNGGGMLPQEAGVFPHDDLVENAVYFSGDQDGTFDPGDYLLFYGAGPHQTRYHGGLDRMVHTYRLYSDTTFYFLTWGGQAGRRMATVPSVPNPTNTASTTRRFAWHERDNYNPLQSGRVWLGETFDLTTSQTFSFNTPDLVPGTNVTVTARVGARSITESTFTLKENGSPYSTITIPPVALDYGSAYYYPRYATFTIPAGNIGDGKVDLELVYAKPVTSAVGYLDYLEVEYRSRLDIGGASQFTFHAIDGVGLGQSLQYDLTGAGAGYRVWDVTDPVNVAEQAITVNGGTLSFGVATPSPKRFIAFNGGFLEPATSRKIANQDLHSLPQADYVIVTHPNFLLAANTLADFHRNHNHRTVNVAQIQEIFNEFSCGAQDPTAIRDFVKMFYDRGIVNGSTMPKYLLLLGDGSYDYKGKAVNAAQNFLPTYQSRLSELPAYSYTSDDYYGFLDDGEGFWGENAGKSGADILFAAEGDNAITTHGLDIAIGRLPVGNANDANMLVEKIISYSTDPEAFGPWRNKVLLVADYYLDEHFHIVQADGYTDDILAHNPCVNIDKVYMDNYTMETTASGSKYPDGKEALIKALNEGSLLVNYTGHGGEIGWSNASILDISDINNLGNGNRQPAYITATCEFGRWDDPARVSGAETVLLREQAGAISMFTTVRVVHAGPNEVLNRNFYDEVFTWDSVNNRMPTMGEIFMRTKNASWQGSINNRNFSLLGDPGMTLAYPSLEAVVTKINGTAVNDTLVDSLGALTRVTIEGEVRDPNEQLAQGFSGDVYVTVFDKPSRFVTKQAGIAFHWQKNKVFNGTASVNGGRFTFSFVIPIDISYENGLGKISLYVESLVADGTGCNNKIYIGGASPGAIVDTRGPELDLFMNEEGFVDGGMVGADPTLIGKVYDENGLNTVGTGIGHELTAVMDGNAQDILILNDYYTANKNSYQEGQIAYPFEDLAPGEHTLEVKVWDVANNSTSGKVTFVVADDASMALGHVLNYPNPFTTNTQFLIEHNRNGSLLDVQVRIYTVSGHLVKTLEDTFFAEGNLYRELSWDGLDDYGDAIGRGVYVYQVRVIDETRGGTVSKFEKLVVLR